MKSGSSGPKWTWASLKPGITSLPPASITSVAPSSIIREIFFVDPTARIVSPFTAIASADGFSLSIVRTFPLIITRSAFPCKLHEADIIVYISDNKINKYFIDQYFFWKLIIFLFGYFLVFLCDLESLWHIISCHQGTKTQSFTK